MEPSSEIAIVFGTFIAIIIFVTVMYNTVDKLHTKTYIYIGYTVAAITAICIQLYVSRRALKKDKQERLMEMTIPMDKTVMEPTKADEYDFDIEDYELQYAAKRK